MRVMYYTYLVGIVAGLGFFVVAGLLHR